jgi:hypothetical protein|nr:MAG TPA: hypothetical protein [Caudoviricetes sp.]
MSNKVSKIVNEEVVEEAVETVVDTVTENVTTDVVPVEPTQPEAVVKQSRVKSTWNWIKQHPWVVAASIGAGLGVIILGKKVYDAGMPAEFEVTEIKNDVIEQPMEHVEVETKEEEQVSEEE